MLLLPFLVVKIAQPEYCNWYKASLINFDFEFSWHRFCLSHFVFDFRSGLGGNSKPISGRISFSIWGFGWCYYSAWILFSVF